MLGMPARAQAKRLIDYIPDDKISSQEYELNLGEDIYLLKMEIISKQKNRL